MPLLKLEVHYSSLLRVDMELRNGKVLLQLSPEAMATTVEAATQETEKLIKAEVLVAQLSTKPTLYHRAQTFTRGYLWVVVASAVLILAAGILLFPQKTWNRIMMQLFGCVTLNIRGKAYRFCEQAPPQQEHAGIPL